MLDLKALKMFHLVGKLGGIGAAARELRVTQSAVSQRLSKLEHGLGKKLHGKSGRQTVLTEEGCRLHESCCRIFDILNSTKASLEGTRSPLLGTVRICALSEVTKALLFPSICKFKLKHPAVSLDISYRRPYEMLGYVCRHEADFAISNEFYRRPQLELVPFVREEVVCVGPAPARKLSWKDLASISWLAYGDDDSLWFELEQMAAGHGITLSRPMLRIADVESILRLAAKGVGYAMAPRHSLTTRSLPGIAIQHMPFPSITKQIYLCRLKTLPLGEAAQALWDFTLAESRKKR